MDKVEEIVERVKDFLAKEVQELDKVDYEDVLAELISDLAIMRDALKKD